MNDLEELLGQRGSADASSILAALREGLDIDPSHSGPAENLHRLLLGYFEVDEAASRSSFGEAFHQHPWAAKHLLELLIEDGEQKVAELMKSLIEDVPCPSGVFEEEVRKVVSLKAAEGNGAIVAALTAFADTAFESAASSVELELSLVWSAVEDGLLDRVQRSACHLAFAHGPTHRIAKERASRLEDLASTKDISKMLQELAESVRPTIVARASDWDVRQGAAPGYSFDVRVHHRLRPGPLGPAKRLPRVPAAEDLHALYKHTNGGELFIPIDFEPLEPGLVFISDGEWDAEKEHIKSWLSISAEEEVLPDWIDSIVPLAFTPGDASRWVTPLEGPYAGAVLLSNDDLLDGNVRYSSVKEFVAAIRICPQEILSIGGYVSYISTDGEYQLYPDGYKEFD